MMVQPFRRKRLRAGLALFALTFACEKKPEVSDGGPGDGGLPSSVVVYPVPMGEAPSPKFEVSVIDGSDAGQPSFVNFDPARQVTTPGNNGTGLQTGRSFSWTTFETDHPVKIQVKRLSGPFNRATLRPRRLGLVARTLKDNTVEFTIGPGRKVSVEFDTDVATCFRDRVECVRDILMVFADRKETTSPLEGVRESDVYRPPPGTYATNATIAGAQAAVVSTLGNAHNSRVVVFEPGVYNIGYWEVPNNVEHIHLSGGAIVYGAINVLPQGKPPLPDDYLKSWDFTLRPSFKVTGHGILSGQKIPWHMSQELGYVADDSAWWKMVRLLRLNVAQLTVADVTLANAPYWALAFANDADARTTGVMSGFKVLGQWAFNTDGLPVPANGRVDDCFVQTSDDGMKLGGSNGSVSNCVLWQFANGGAFQLGWYPKTISNIDISSIDLIHGEWFTGANDNVGLVSYANGGGSGVISNVNFTNITIEGEVLRLIGIFPTGGQQLNKLTFTNVTVDAWGHDVFETGRFNVLSALDGGSVDGITFKNLSVGGQVVTNAKAATLGRFQSQGAVTNVQFIP